MQKNLQKTTILLLVISVVLLTGIQVHPLGFLPFILGLLLLSLTGKEFIKDISLLYLAILILSFTPINPDISWGHIATMGSAIFSVVFIPYFISRFAFKNHHVIFPIRHGKGWSKFEIGYFFFVIIMSYLIIPFYLKNTGAYLNWNFDPNWNSIAKFFIGINVVGIWDELFFVNVSLGMFKRHLNFILANIAQAVIFSSVLYDFGFKGWGFAMIFIFAITQGYVFKKTGSILYIIIVHLSLDFVLFLALLNAHHPNWIPIFITSGI